MCQMIGGHAMGGPWFAKIDSPLPEARLHRAIQTALDTVEDAMSPWRPEAEVNRFAHCPPGSYEMSPALAEVLTCALALHGASGGAFDPRLGAEISARGFGPEGLAPLPPARLDLDGQLLTLSGPVRLNLCALAKGYGVDRAAQALRDLGVGRFLLNATGEIRAHGPGWRVALELPLPGQQVIFRKIPLEGALASSGNYLKRRGQDSHLLDGRGGAAPSGLLGVSVLHDSAMQADGWATALAVLGPQDGPDLARQQGLRALFVSAVEGGFREESIGFPAGLR